MERVRFKQENVCVRVHRKTEHDSSSSAQRVPGTFVHDFCPEPGFHVLPPAPPAHQCATPVRIQIHRQPWRGFHVVPGEALAEMSFGGERLTFALRTMCAPHSNARMRIRTHFHTDSHPSESTGPPWMFESLTENVVFACALCTASPVP